MKNKLSAKSSNNTERIKQITKEIPDLTKELEELLIQDETSSSIEIYAGDRVVITNNHKGLRDARGTVTNVTKKQACIKLESGCIVQRAKKNLRQLKNGSPSSARR